MARFEGHMGIYVLYGLIGISGILMIPVNVLILIKYCQHREIRAQRVCSFCFFMFTLLFYMNFIGRLLNECIGSHTYEWIFAGTTYSLYGLHFPNLLFRFHCRLVPLKWQHVLYENPVDPAPLGIHFSLLVYLLFRRLYNVFAKSQYKMSRSSVVCFIALFIFIVCDVATFVFVIYTNSDGAQLLISRILYIGGLAGMILMSVGITFLYSYKLFRLIRSHLSHSPRPSSRDLLESNERLIANVSKYTLLAVLWISTGIIFWISPVIAYYRLVDYLWYILYIFSLLYF